MPVSVTKLTHFMYPFEGSEIVSEFCRERMNTDLGNLAEQCYDALPYILERNYRVFVKTFGSESLKSNFKYSMLRQWIYQDISDEIKDTITSYYFPKDFYSATIRIPPSEDCILIYDKLFFALCRDVDKSLSWLTFNDSFTNINEEELIKTRREFMRIGYELYGQKSLFSSTFGIKGIPDYLVCVNDLGYVVKDLKFVSLKSKEILEKHKFQVSCYAILVEEALKIPIRYGKIYYLSHQREILFEIPSNFRQSLELAVDQYKKR